MGKTQKQYEDEYLVEGSKRIEKEKENKQTVVANQKDARKKQTTDYIAGQNKIIDDALAHASGKVQEQIDAAPGAYQEVFDRNALSEELGRRNVEIKMANMGMTDSGLNVASQTALSAQRINADADSRKSMREYIDKMESTIRDMTVEATGKKESIALQRQMEDDAYFSGLDTYMANWESAARADLATNAANYGATMWQADQENAAKIDAARIEAEGKAQDKAHDMVMTLVKAGTPYEEAVVKVYGAESQQTDEAKHDKQVADVLSSIPDSEYNISGWHTFWSTPAGDGEEVYEQIVRDKMEQSSAYASLSPAGQLDAVAKAVGKAVANTWTPDGDNKERIQSAIAHYCAGMFGYANVADFEEKHSENREHNSIYLDMCALADEMYGRYRKAY